MSDSWPPEGLTIPAYDEHDARAVGWEIGRGSDGTEWEGCSVLQTGRCGDHFALILPPGASIACREDGTLEMTGVTFMGHGAAAHEPGCPSA